jgi:hypothetical protein
MEFAGKRVLSCEIIDSFDASFAGDYLDLKLCPEPLVRPLKAQPTAANTAACLIRSGKPTAPARLNVQFKTVVFWPLSRRC